MVLEKALESPLDCKEIKSINPKRNQLIIVIGKTDAEAEAPTLWPPDMKNQLTGKDPDARKDKAKGEEGGRGCPLTADSMYMSVSQLRKTEGQGSLACCSPWGRRVGHD